MKYIAFRPLLNPEGKEIHDTAPDALSEEHRVLLAEGKPLPPDAGPVIDTLYMLKRMIDLSTYATRKEQKEADALYVKLAVGDLEDGFQVFSLEDSEYAMVMRMKENFTPYLNGRVFALFHEVMENPVDLKDHTLPPKQR